MRIPIAVVRVRSGMLGLLLAAGLTPLAAQDNSRPAGDTVARRRIQPLPALGSAPETGLQFGATVLAVWEPPAMRRTRPSSLLASALRTSESQTRLRVEGEHWTTGNAQRIAASVQWQQFPLPYFGIGDRSLNTAEEIFTPRGTEATLSVQQRIAPSWYATAGVRHLDQRIATDSAGQLRRGGVIGAEGGAMTEWTLGVLTDTRDNLFAPHRGRWVQLSYGRSARQLWSDFSYGTARLDARGYRSLTGEHVIASHLQVLAVDGAAPFDQLALVGGSDIMRGYARGRFRDRALAAAQLEYRSAYWHRLGGVVFMGAGASAPRLDGFADARLLPTYGAGLRARIDARQRTGVRVDYGRGRAGASGLYIGFNQAF